LPHFRPRDLLVRYGGDEFAVLLPDVDYKQATEIGERVLEKIRGGTSDAMDSLIQIPIRISMGVAELTPQGTLESLIRDADAALYRAKNAGRDRVSN
jgi:diguanylate cyclase (GGDEF)-like protein